MFPWLCDASAIDLNCLNDTRNYDAFGCLFGVRNFANFRPVAADRGVPDDATDFTPAHGTVGALRRHLDQQGEPGRTAPSGSTAQDWPPVWAVMRALASVHGDDNVRLIVWFDN